MFRWFFRQKEVEKIKEDTKRSFDSVKNDIQDVSQWIKHLNFQKSVQENEIKGIKEDLSSIKEELEGLKNMVSILGNTRSLNRVGVSNS